MTVGPQNDGGVMQWQSLFPLQIHWEASPEKQMDCLQKGKNNKVELADGCRGGRRRFPRLVTPVLPLCRPSASTTCGFCRG